MNVPLVDLKAQYNLINREINTAIKKVIASGNFIKGDILEDFEKDFAKFIGVKHTIGVASGTDALFLSLIALGIKKGDEIILPVNTFVATAYSVIYAGGVPVFVDIDPLTQNIQAEGIEEKITNKTKAIIPVHLFGQPAEMDKISKIARKHKLYLLEDCAQSHGAKYKKRNIGTFGNLAAFSFYPGKNLGAYGDGGAIATNSNHLMKRIKELREYGSLKKYFYKKIGYNSRLDTIQAAVLQVKLKYLTIWNKKRQEAAQYYNEIIKGQIPFIQTPGVNNNSSSVFHLYIIQTPKRNGLIKYLKSKGIQTGIHYPIPLHLQKSLKFLQYKKGDFPVGEKISKKILSLPLYPELTFKQQDYVVESIKQFFKI